MESNNFYSNFEDELSFLIDSTVTSECYNPNSYNNHISSSSYNTNHQHYQQQQQQSLNGQQNHYQYTNGQQQQITSNHHDHVNGYHHNNGYNHGHYNSSPTSTSNVHPLHSSTNQIQTSSLNTGCPNQQPSSLNQINYDQLSQNNSSPTDMYSNYNNTQSQQLTESGGGGGGFVGTNNNPLIRSLLTSPKNSSSSSSSPSASSTSSNISTGTTTTSHSSDSAPSPYFSHGCPSSLNGLQDNIHVQQQQNGSVQFSPDHHQTQHPSYMWNNTSPNHGQQYQYTNQSPNGFYGHNHHMHHSPQQKIVPVTSGDGSLCTNEVGSNGLRIIAPGLQISQQPSLQQQQQLYQNSDSRSAVTTTGGLISSSSPTSSPSSSLLTSPSSSSQQPVSSSSSFSPNSSSLSSLSFPTHQHHPQQQQQQQLVMKSGVVASNVRMMKNHNHHQHPLHHVHHMNGHNHNNGHIHSNVHNNSSNGSKNNNSINNNNITTKVREKKTSKKRRDPNEPQKPVSAYALFFRDTQAVIKGNNPNASFGEVSKIVASMWDQLDPDSKVSYKKRTEQAKREYLQALAAYRASTLTQTSSPN